MKEKLLKTISQSGLSQTAFAKKIGYSRVNLNHIINGNQGRTMTVELALRLEKAGFGNVWDWVAI